MIRVLAEAVRSINSVVAENINDTAIRIEREYDVGANDFCLQHHNILKGKKEVNKMVEFDAIKQSLANYAQPLLEMGDSL